MLKKIFTRKFWKHVKVGTVGIGGALLAGCNGLETRVDSIQEKSKPVIVQQADYVPIVANPSDSGTGNEDDVKSQVKPEPVKDETKYDLSGTVEFNSSHGADMLKETLRFKWDKGDLFRAHNYKFTGKQGNNDLAYTAAALALPLHFSVGKLDFDNKLNLFGMLGDKQGLGIQAKHGISNNDFGKLTFNWTLERVLAEEKDPLGIKSPRDPVRVGFGLDYDPSKNFGLGVGFDRLMTVTKVKDSYLIKMTGKLTDHDQVGLGLNFVESKEYGRENPPGKAMSAFWCHYGPKEKWGTRTWTMLGACGKNKNLVFDTIFALNPTFSQYSSPWIIGREHGDMFGLDIVDNALDTEGCPLYKRTAKGLAAELKVGYNSCQGAGRGGFVKGEVAFRSPAFDLYGLKASPAISTFYNYGFNKSERLSDKHTIGGIGALSLKWKGLDFSIEGNINHTLEGKHSKTGYGAKGTIGWKF